MATKEKESEEVRTRNASDLMYGNKDTKKLFPFDVRARFEWLIYSEKLGQTEDGQIYSKKTSQKYQHFTPDVYASAILSTTRKNYFERLGLRYVILHDPFLQAKIEGITLKGDFVTKSGKTLEERLATAKDATDFGKPNTAPFTLDLTSDDDIEFIDEDGDALDTIIEGEEPEVEGEERVIKRRVSKKPAKRRQVATKNEEGE